MINISPKSLFRLALIGFGLLTTLPLSAQITEVVDLTGGGAGTLDNPIALADDPSGNVFIAAQPSNAVFRITPAGSASIVIDATGDGTNALNLASAVTVANQSGTWNVYVAGFNSDNVFRIENVAVPVEISSMIAE